MKTNVPAAVFSGFLTGNEPVVFSKNAIGGVVELASNATTAQMMCEGNNFYVPDSTSAVAFYLVDNGVGPAPNTFVNESFQTATPWIGTSSTGNTPIIRVRDCLSLGIGAQYLIDGLITPINGAYTPKLRGKDIAIPAGTTTPDVSGGYLFTTSNTAATTIAFLENGAVEQVVEIVIGDSHTIVDFTQPHFFGNGGAAWTPSLHDHMVCVFDGTNWYCAVFHN